MSSHHIVRDRQEPALLVLSLEGFNEEYLGQLLEWSPLVFSVLAEAEKLHVMGIKIDSVFVEKDDVSPLNSFQEHTELVKLSHLNVPNTIQFLINEGFPAINIIGSVETLSLLLPFTRIIDLVLFTAATKWFPVNNVLEKWYRKGEDLVVFSGEGSSIKLSNSASVGNNRFVTLCEGIVTIEAGNKPIFVGENL
ncbi:hypothetical protein [Solitalea koreensis]|uniref:Thiamine pyrophosphokinase n=1 Tax=Solitalea koreensis TaxID=543615 RepID=A0A521CA01_9SPHI|nr:hypothetical protein [Solitalea koreensis]SMO56226.1 thiamine pyrophosphokinase [Solitalea koreensis]